jgi:high affinity sulfate transporter 1
MSPGRHHPDNPACCSSEMIRHRGGGVGSTSSAAAAAGRNDPLIVPDEEGATSSDEDEEDEGVVDDAGAERPLVQAVQQHHPPESSSSSWSALVGQIRFLWPPLRRVLVGLFPCGKWLSTYDVRKSIFADVVSGVSVGIMIIPQSMSYGTLAGLPVQYGLYAAISPLYMYSLCGSSPQLAVGPVAMVSLLFRNGLAQIVFADDSNNKEQLLLLYESLAVQSAALAGIIYLLLYVCQLGWWTQYLSHAVISGFTTGAAVLIGLSQLQHLVGYKVPGQTLIEILVNAVRHIDQINYRTVLYGSAFTVFLLLVRQIKRPSLRPLQIAGPLIVTIIALLVPNNHNDDDGDNNNSFTLPVVGPIPRGLPRWTIHQWWPRDDESVAALVQFLPTIFSIVLVGFMESIAIAKSLAARNGGTVDSNAELYGLGMANLAGGALHGYPIAGSFSRSAVNAQAHSPLAGAITATTVVVTVSYLTVTFQSLPLCALAAIVLAGVYGVVDVHEALHLYREEQFGDLVVWMTACFGVMLLGVEAGLALSIAVSFLVLVPWRPFVHRMRRSTATSPDDLAVHYVDMVESEMSGNDHVPDEDGVVILRLSSSLNFANVNWVWSKVDLNNNNNNNTTRCIVLEMTAVSTIDSAATSHVKKWIDECASKQIAVYLVGCSQHVKDRLVAALAGEQGTTTTIVQSRTVEDAVLSYRRRHSLIASEATTP